MIKFSVLVGGGVTALLALMSVSPAQAATVRAWVSGHGSDVASCGAPATPCRTLQYTHDNIVAAGGEIDILDPAGYGTLIINKSISIVNDGVGTAGVQAASGVAIVINAGPTDVIRLKGLNIEGLGTASEGIQFNSGASLTVEDCTIKDFNFQVQFAPTASAFLYMTNTKIEHAQTGGLGINIVSLVPSGGAVHAVLEHVEADDNGQAGVFIDNRSAAANAPLNVTISDSVFSDSSRATITTGVHAIGPDISVLLDNSTVSNNSQYGVASEQGATVVVSRSSITGNATAFGGGGTFQSYGDNRTTGNTAMGVTPTILTPH